MKNIPYKSTFVLLALSFALAAGWCVDRWESTLVIKSMETEQAVDIYAPASRYHRYFDFAFAGLDNVARRTMN